MALFFIAFAMVFYLRGLKDNSIKNWALFGILSAFAFWSHFYVFVLIAALVAYALALQAPEIRKNIRNIGTILLAVVLFSLASLPLIIVTIPLFFTRTAAAPTFGVQGFDIIYQILVQIGGESDILLVLFGALFIVGAIQAYLTDKKQGVLLVSVLLLTFIITYVLSYKMPMESRHLIFISCRFTLAWRHHTGCSTVLEQQGGGVPADGSPHRSQPADGCGLLLGIHQR